jgi:hypothetical protein
VSYLVSDSRDIATAFPLLPEPKRFVLIDGVRIPIVHKLQGQMPAKPGVNLIFRDEREDEFRTNPQGWSRATAIHLYVPVTNNPIADERIASSLQDKIDAALYEKTVSIYDFNTTPPTSTGRCGWWLSQSSSDWQELTDLNLSANIHRAHIFELRYDGELIS